MRRTALGLGWLGFEGFFGPVYHHKPNNPSNHPSDCPCWDWRKIWISSSPSKCFREPVLTSALDSDSDSVLDSTMHFCCRGGRERNATQAEVTAASGWSWSPSTNCRHCFSKAFPPETSLSFQISHISAAGWVVWVRHKGKIEVHLHPPPKKIQKEASQNMPCIC